VPQVFGIAFAQFLGCSLWFSVNGVSAALIDDWGVDPSAIGWLTGAVQAGFIAGTLGLAITNLADRFRASSIFLWASIAGSIANLLFAYQASDLTGGLVYRFIVGVCLAGIYPIGMKLIVSWSPKLPGVGLGLVVGMLTLGTASPHLLNTLALSPDWRLTLIAVSMLALFGGLFVRWIGEGPIWNSPKRANSVGCCFFELSAVSISSIGLWLFWSYVGVVCILDARSLVSERSHA
jgi:MFS family permease